MPEGAPELPVGLAIPELTERGDHLASVKSDLAGRGRPRPRVRVPERAAPARRRGDRSRRRRADPGAPEFAPTGCRRDRRGARERRRDRPPVARVVATEPASGEPTTTLGTQAGLHLRALSPLQPSDMPQCARRCTASARRAPLDRAAPRAGCGLESPANLEVAPAVAGPPGEPAWRGSLVRQSHVAKTCGPVHQGARQRGSRCGRPSTRSRIRRRHAAEGQRPACDFRLLPVRPARSGGDRRKAAPRRGRRAGGLSRENGRERAITRASP